MRRVIGMDLHRTFAEVVVWEEGRLRHAGRVDLTRSGVEGFACSLQKSDEVVVEATGNAMVVSHLLTPHVARVVIANPIQVKAIAHAHVKTDKIDAGVLANLYAAGYLPEVWTPDEGTERLRRLVARRNQVVRHRTRLKNETHSMLHAYLVPQFLRPKRPQRGAGQMFVEEIRRAVQACQRRLLPESSATVWRGFAVVKCTTATRFDAGEFFPPRRASCDLEIDEVEDAWG